MTERYIYTDRVGAGPEHPKKQWGLFSKELTTDEAVARYDLDAARREDWFGVVLQSDDQRPHAYLQMCPRANGVEMHKLNAQGSVDVATPGALITHRPIQRTTTATTAGSS